jgi:hypothetical protein
MPKEKGDLPEFPVEHRPNETGAVEVKFGGTEACPQVRAKRPVVKSSFTVQTSSSAYAQ